MSGQNRVLYKSATILDQNFLNWCADNLTNQIELIIDIERPDGSFIHASDRNKYVGGTFYEALLNFPTVTKTIGEWLSSELEFSTLQIELSNADGRFNDILPSGAGFSPWINKVVNVKIGLRDVASSYKTIFKGIITEIGGMKRTIKSITLIARDTFDRLNVTFPIEAFTLAEYPLIENDKDGTLKPIIYGDWTTGLTNNASIPAIPINGNDPNVYEEAGLHNNVKCVISKNVNTFLDATAIFVKRSSDLFQVAGSDIVNVNADKNYFEVRQNTGATLVGEKLDTNYLFSTGDVFYVKVKGKDLGSYDDNIVAIGKDILKTYAGLVDGDFATSWATYRSKASPSESAIANIKARAWVAEAQPCMAYVLSLFEQVRLESFVNRDLLLDINALHFDEFESNPSFEIKNWDIEKGTFQPQLDERNNFNRVQGAFAFEPILAENNQLTSLYRNQAAINAIGKAISKKIVFPNLYIRSQVEQQVIEMLKLASSYIEMITCNITSRGLLLDLGNFVKIDVKIGSSIFDNVPAMIRRIGYNPDGLKMEMVLWSFQMCPFPNYNPAYAGITGGYNAIIAVET